MSANLQRTLLGLDPAAVEAGLAARMQEHRRQVSAVQQLLQLEWREHEDLQQRIFAAEERLSQQLSVASPLDAVRVRLEGSSPLMRDVVDRMVRDMEANMERERATMAQQIARLDEKILVAQDQLNQLLEQAALVATLGGQGAHAEPEAPQRPAAGMPLDPDPAPQPQAAQARETHHHGAAALFPWAAQSAPVVEPVALPPEPEEREPLVVRHLPLNPASGFGADSPAPVATDTRPATWSTAAALKPVRPAEADSRTESHLLRYVAGKMLGQDLRGRSGGLLAGKGTPISAEIVDLAQAEGVMSDLILHMI